MFQTFTSWISGSFNKCHTVHLPHADSCHCSQQFPHCYYLCKVKHMKVSILSLLMLSLRDTTCSSIHFPPHSLHGFCCAVLQARSESCGLSRYLSRTARVNWHLQSQVSVPALTTLPCLNWCWGYGDCITIGMTSSEYEISHYSGTPPRISLVSYCQDLTILTQNFASCYL